MNKTIMGIIATFLILGTALSPPPTEDGEIAFKLTIQRDASISITELRTNDSSPILDFRPAITDIDEAEALPVNVNETETDGHWSITNIGNVPAYIYLQLNDTLPTGIQTEVGINKTYDNNYYLDITDKEANWLYNMTDGIDGAPLDKTLTTDFWQRVSADNTATGDTEANLKIIITSFAEAQVEE